MAGTAMLAPLSVCVPGYPEDAPQWGDELLDADASGFADEIRRHIVLALRSSRQPPIDGPEAVRDQILSGEILPLNKKWRTYALDARRRVDHARHGSAIRQLSWVTRRVPTADELRRRLPLAEGGCYLVVYGGGDRILTVSDPGGSSVASDLASLRSAVPVADVVGWMPQEQRGVRWWSLAGMAGMDATTPFEIADDVIAACGGPGWGGMEAPVRAHRTTNATALSELIPSWASSDPAYGDDLVEADEEKLSDTAVSLRRHVLLATRSSADLTVATPDEARERLKDRHMVPKEEKWSVYALDDNRKRIMVPSKWGQQALRKVFEALPETEWLAEKLVLPRKGRWLIVWGGFPSQLRDGRETIEALLRDERVADVCSWNDRAGVFASSRANSVMEADGTVRELFKTPGHEGRDTHHHYRKEG